MSWSIGNTIGVIPLKFTDHTKSNQDLEYYIYELNDYLFLFSRKYISPSAKTTLKDVLRHFGTKISEITDDKVKARKNEALTQIKAIYHAITKYEPDEEDTESVTKIYNYQLARYLKMKNDMSPEDIVKFLKENKIVYANYICTKSPSFRHFINMQKELVDKLTKLFLFT